MLLDPAAPWGKAAARAAAVEDPCGRTPLHAALAGGRGGGGGGDDDPAAVAAAEIAEELLRWERQGTVT